MKNEIDQKIKSFMKSLNNSYTINIFFIEIKFYVSFSHFY